MIILTTERLILRQAVPTDAAFFYELMNDPDWIRFIGDRGIKTLEDAANYVKERLQASYEKHGFGLYLTQLKDGTPIGICGLIQRDFLEDTDIGFGFLPNYRGQGYAHEAAVATMKYAKEVLKIDRVVAFTSVDNDRSGHLLEKIGLRFDSIFIYPETEDDECKMYVPI